MRKGKLFRCNFSLFFVENVVKLKREDLDCVESCVPKDFELELVFEDVDGKVKEEERKRMFEKMSVEFEGIKKFLEVK